MQLNFTSLFLLKKRAAKKKADSTLASSSARSDKQQVSTSRKNRREKFNDWLSPKPAPIQLFPGEKEILRKGLILVTDTRLAYIDPFDRMLKTYMFEHMISMHKQFYRTTVFNRRLCKSLLFISSLALLIVVIIDLLDSKSSGFYLVYLPLMVSLFIGIKVWNDMKPWYVIHWRMRDNTYGEITQEPMLRERIKGDNKREEFMVELANAMNQALSGKAWWPTTSRPDLTDQLSSESTTDSESNSSQGTAADRDQTNNTAAPQLTLVTDNYQ